MLVAFSVIIGAGTGCKKKETCFDDKLNQDETGVDCGGVCDPCPSCFDGILGWDEDKVDCGGVCPPCPSCFDGIQNQNETGVDCGGPCQTCTPTFMRAEIDGLNWVASLIVADDTLGALKIHGQNDTCSILIHYNGTFQAGKYPLKGLGAVYSSRNGQYNCISDSGYITFTIWNQLEKTVTGDFEFWCTDQNTGGSLETSAVTVGEFSNIQY